MNASENLFKTDVYHRRRRRIPMYENNPLDGNNKKQKWNDINLYEFFVAVDSSADPLQGW